MTRLITAFGLALLAAGPARAAEDDAEYERLRKVKTCIETLRGASDRLETIVTTWFTDEESAVSLARSFAVLKQRHADYFETLRQRAAARDDVPADFDGLVEAMRAVDRPDPTLTRASEWIAEGDERFTWSLLAVDDGLAEVDGEFQAARGSCGAEDGPMIDRSSVFVGDLRLQVNLMRGYLAEAAAKRGRLAAATVLARKMRLYRAYADRTQTALQDLVDRATAALAADQLLGRIEDWWFVAGARNGLGRGLVNRYLQYTDALRVQRADYEEGAKLRAELAEIPSLDATTRAHVSADLEHDLGQLSDQAARLEQGGWQPVFERQRYLTGRRRALADRYPEACGKVIAAYDAVAAGVVDADSFRSAEWLYRTEVNVCTTGGTP